MTTSNPVYDWATLTREMRDLLTAIVEDWSRDEFHDVPLVLIERARDVLRRIAT